MKRQVPSSWSREQICLLLEELKNTPLLYDQTHPCYPFRTHKIEALQMIARKLQPIKPTVTPELISLKIRGLKAQYYKEKKCVEGLSADLKEGDPSYQPKLWCYEMLKFLDNKSFKPIKLPAFTLPVEQKVTTPENLDDQSDKCSNDPFEEIEINVAEQQPQTNHSQTRSMLHRKCLNLVQTLTKEIKIIKSNKNNEYSATNQQSPQAFLGLLVESELSGVSEETYCDAKWKIIHILEEASRKEHDMKSAQPINSPAASSSNASYRQGRQPARR